jgi:hypothetical protein
LGLCVFTINLSLYSFIYPGWLNIYRRRE